MLETPLRKRPYLELRLSESRNQGLSTKITTSSTILRYLLYVFMTVDALSNSLFAGETSLYCYVERSSPKRPYLELWLSESRNPGLPTKLALISMYLWYQFYVFMMCFMFCNSIFVRQICSIGEGYEEAFILA